MLDGLRHIGTTLTRYADRVGRTARLVGAWLTATADLVEQTRLLWGDDGDDIHSKSKASSEQATLGTGANSRRKGESEAGDGNLSDRAIQRGARVLGRSARRSRLPPQIEETKESGQGDSDRASSVGGTDSLDSLATQTTETVQ